MITKKVWWVILSITVIAVSVLYFSPSDKRQIKTRLIDLTEDLSFSAKNSGQIATALWADKIADYFSEVVAITLEEVNGQTWSLDKRENLKQTLLAARPRLGSLKVSMNDLVVSVESSITSRAIATLTAQWQEKGFDSSLWAREVIFELVKHDRQWFVVKVESVSVIKR
ncbi:MAG: hypothetical protein AAB677_01475 [Patescibacteria group bacterium]